MQDYLRPILRLQGRNGGYEEKVSKRRRFIPPKHVRAIVIINLLLVFKR